jgi:hypothetical protein
VINVVEMLRLAVALVVTGAAVPDGPVAVEAGALNGETGAHGDALP